MATFEFDGSLLLKVLWGVLGIWIGVALAMTTVGVSLPGLLLGFLLAGLIGIVGIRASERFITTH
jgi:hypothetical protein